MEGNTFAILNFELSNAESTHHLIVKSLLKSVFIKTKTL